LFAKVNGKDVLNGQSQEDETTEMN